MKQRIITGVILAVSAIVLIMLSKTSFHILMLSLVVVGVVELYQMKEHHYNYFVPILTFSGIYLLNYFNGVGKLVIISAAFLLLGLIHIIDENFGLREYLLTFGFVILFGLAINGGLTLYALDGPLAILWIFIANYGSDTGAYFVGSFLGKHPLNKRLSPNKTIEGSIGGWLLGFILAFAFGTFFLVKNFTPNFLLVGSATLPILAQVGDLFFSSIKRSYKIKDFGGIFPGHGGVLDRVDSLVFSLFFINLLLMVWSLL